MAGLDRIKMGIDRAIRNPSDMDVVHSLAGDLASTITRCEPEMLAHFGAVSTHAIDSLPVVNDDNASVYLRGILTGLRLVAVGVEGKSRIQAESASIRNLARSAPYADILSKLVLAPMMQNEIATAIGKDKSVVTRAMRELVLRDLVAELPQTVDADKRKKFFRLTFTGERLIRRTSLPRVEKAATGPIGYVEPKIARKSDEIVTRLPAGLPAGKRQRSNRISESGTSNRNYTKPAGV